MPPEPAHGQEGRHENTGHDVVQAQGLRKDDGVVTILDETIDLEAYAAKGEQPPLAKGYKIKINGKAIIIEKPKVTGKEILTIAGLLPAADYTLRLKRAGQKPEKNGLDEVVDLRQAGVEKFTALPKDQTEG